MSQKGSVLHWKILIGLLCGVLWGLIAPSVGLDAWTTHWISPIGDLFVRFLKLIAIPLVMTSLVLGMTSVDDRSQLAGMGFRTAGFYLLTTALAILVGLAVASWVQPGTALPADLREELSTRYEIQTGMDGAVDSNLENRSWMQFIADLVPENMMSALGANDQMLQVVLLALLFGLGLLQLPTATVRPVTDLFKAVQDVLTLFVSWIMQIAPYGVFALMAHVLVEISGDGEDRVWSVLAGLSWYAGTVVAAMGIHIFVVYWGLYRGIVQKSFRGMLQTIRPAILLGFSTSSSVATLPVTLDCVERGLGIAPRISRFVLPVGTTINMDGTSIYQAVSALFIAQALGMDLTLMQQGTILFTALLASIGSAGVPGAGVVMLVVVLESIQVPVEGIALILGLERILDMVRTALNVTGDAVVASLVSATENEQAETVISDV
ncbi:MAG: dicarboxylate/amino acid:cation symporter [Balneolaceae bacterium]